MTKADFKIEENKYREIIAGFQFMESDTTR